MHKHPFLLRSFFACITEIKEKIMMDGFWKTQSSIQDGCDPNISDSYLIVIGKAEPLSSAKLGKTSCENGLFFAAV